MKCPLKWENVKVHFNTFLTEFQRVLYTNPKEKDIVNIIGCFLDSLLLCDDYDDKSPFLFLKNLINSLPITETILYRVLIFFCYHVLFLFFKCGKWDSESLGNRSKVNRTGHLAHSVSLQTFALSVPHLYKALESTAENLNSSPMVL